MHYGAAILDVSQEIEGKKLEDVASDESAVASDKTKDLKREEVFEETTDVQEQNHDRGAKLSHCDAEVDDPDPVSTLNSSLNGAENYEETIKVAGESGKHKEVEAEMQYNEGYQNEETNDANAGSDIQHTEAISEVQVASSDLGESLKETAIPLDSENPSSLENSTTENVHNFLSRETNLKEDECEADKFEEVIGVDGEFGENKDVEAEIQHMEDSRSKQVKDAEASSDTHF